MPLEWRNQLWQSLEEGAGKQGSECDLCSGSTIVYTPLLGSGPCSVQNGIYALEKQPKKKKNFNHALHPSLRSFPNVAFETVQSVRLIDDGPFSSLQGRSPNTSSLLQAIDGVMPWLCADR